MMPLLNSNIRPVIPEDLDALKIVVDSADLFPAELLDEMIFPYFNNNPDEFWITYIQDNIPIAVAYYAPEKMTSGTYNLFLIAVHPDFQHHNIGTELLGYIESHLKNLGERILIIETSGLPDFNRARDFYLKNHYDKEAMIKDFYASGDDKIIFKKYLQ